MKSAESCDSSASVDRVSEILNRYESEVDEELSAVGGGNDGGAATSAAVAAPSSTGPFSVELTGTIVDGVFWLASRFVKDSARRSSVLLSSDEVERLGSAWCPVLNDVMDNLSDKNATLAAALAVTSVTVAGKMVSRRVASNTD